MERPGSNFRRYWVPRCVTPSECCWKVEQEVVENVENDHRRRNNGQEHGQEIDDLVPESNMTQQEMCWTCDMLAVLKFGPTKLTIKLL